jgi:hypothetical protein
MKHKFVLVLAIVLSSACRSADPYDVNEPRPQGAMLVVNNQYFYDMDLYAVGDGLATRIGTVTGNSTGRFALNESLRSSTNLQIVGTPIGGNGRASTGLIHPSGGETITFTISPTLRGNAVLIR